MTDIEIAQKTKLKSIKEIGEKIGIKEDELELYGNYKAKLQDNIYKRLAEKKDGKLILVTAINPTPAGEGKTTVTIGRVCKGVCGRKTYKGYIWRYVD